jgi:hypothetical protein
MEAGHGVARHLGESRLGGIFRLRIRAAEADGGLFELQFLSEGDLLANSLAIAPLNGVSSDRDAATEKAIVSDEDEVRRAGTEIEEQRAALRIGVIVAEGVEVGPVGAVSILSGETPAFPTDSTTSLS